MNTWRPVFTSTTTTALQVLEFLQLYPDNPVGADMLFAKAIKLISTGQYDDASGLLERVVKEYPQAGPAQQARQILQQRPNQRPSPTTQK